MIEALAATKRNTRGLVSLAVVVLAWGSLWPVNKAILAYIPPIWSIALRTCISAATLFVISLAVTGIVIPRRGDALAATMLLPVAILFEGPPAPALRRQCQIKFATTEADYGFRLARTLDP